MLIPVDGDWLEGPDWVVANLMTYLAMQVSRHEGVQLITNERAASKAAVGPGEPRMVSRRLSAVAQLLPVPPDAGIGEIHHFKEQHHPELVRFREAITALITRDPHTTRGNERFQERLIEAQRVRDHLLGEMEATG